MKIIFLMSPEKSCIVLLAEGNNFAGTDFADSS